MVDSPYTGAAVRGAHFAWRQPVQGVNNDHTTPDPEPDLFNPVPTTPPGLEQTVWRDEPAHAGPSGQPNLAQIPVSHQYFTPPPAALNTPRAQAMQAMQDRLMHVHSQAHYVPDGIRLYQHYSEGQHNEWQIGRMPQAAGQEIPDGPLAGLGNGKNSYDQTNDPRPEIYQGAPENVARYRLGVKTNIFGLYENPIGLFGQTAMLHAYTGLYPATPQDKPPMTDTAPYTPNSTGTAHWAPAVPFQKPRLFSLPSETALTDFAIANPGDYTSDFTDTKGGFY